MSQSVTLYNISGPTFSALSDGDAQPSLLDIARSYQTFYCFEGLHFMLPQIAVDPEGFTSQIFYPNTAVTLHRADDEGVQIPGTEKEQIFYNPPDVVKAIAVLLRSINVEEVQKAFDPVELNEKKIYPNGAWNNNSGGEWAFNLDHIVQEYSLLQKFYSLASEEENFVLSFTG
jgi:hypothetical protein